MTQLAAEALGVPTERVDFELRDSDRLATPIYGGSITLVSVGNAVVAACDALRTRLAALAGADGVSGGVSDMVALLSRHGLQSVQADGQAKPGDATERFASAAFGAVFVEVRVDPPPGTVRVPRTGGA